MYMCMPPTPSSFEGGRSSRIGRYPFTDAPTGSVMYFPTSPVEFAMPLGKSVDFEFSMMRAVSQQLSASTSSRGLTEPSLRDILSMYETPIALLSGPYA